MLSKPWESKEFKNFKLFWDSEVEKILCRCVKEANCYKRLKMVLMPEYYADNPNEFFYTKYYSNAIKNLRNHKKEIITYSTYSGNRIRKFPVMAVIKNKRHLSQFIAVKVLNDCRLYGDDLTNAFMLLDKKLYKGHCLNTFLCDKLYYLKLFFKL